MPGVTELAVQVSITNASLLRDYVREQPQQRILHDALRALIRIGGYEAGWIAGRLEPDTPEDRYSILRSPAESEAATTAGEGPEGRGEIDPATVSQFAQRALRTGSISIRRANEAANDLPDEQGWPPVAPGLDTFALPIKYQDRILGVVILSAIPGTVGEEFLEPLSPLVETLGLLVHADESRWSRLRQESDRNRLFELTPELLAIAHRDGYFRRVNPAFERVLGYTSEELYATPFIEFVHPDDRAATVEQFHQILRGHDVQDHENRFLCKDGSEAWLSWSGSKSDSAGYIYCVASCITERKQSELRFRENEALLESVIESLPMAFWVTSHSGDFLFQNHRFIERWGDLRGAQLEALPISEEARREWKFAHDRAFSGQVFRGESVFEIEGERRFFQTTVAPMREGSHIFGVLGFHVDITDQKLSEEVAQRTKERLDLALSGADLGMWDWDLVSGEIVINERWAGMLGYAVEDIEPYAASREALIHPDDRPWIKEIVLEHFKGKTPFFEIEHRLKARDGSWIWVLNMGKVVERDLNGRALRAAGTHLEITERKQAESSLKLRERILRSIANASERFLKTSSWQDGASTTLQELGEASEVSRVYIFQNERMTEEGALSSRPLFWWSEATAPEGDEQLRTQGVDLEHPVFTQLRETLERGDVFRAQAREIPSGQGHMLDIQHARSIVLVPIIVGKVWWGLVGFDQCDREREWTPADIDTLKLAAGIFGAAIHREQVEVERQNLEEGIRQAQKLESLGVLAGGVAHDFNNLLMGILGNASLAMADLGIHSPARSSVEQIEIAAQRAADLTRQLLAYAGKGRFVVQPLEIGNLIEEMRHLLEVSVSKKASLKIKLQPELPFVEADAAQMRQIIINLMTNASEAIGDQPGILSLATGLVEFGDAAAGAVAVDDPLPPGHYLFIEVIDTGTGMEPATIERIFDPFYTTKFTGRGLGLAAVLGIVRSHGGGIRVESSLGEGSRFTVYLPVSGSEIAGPDVPMPGVQPGQPATILVIDDEDTVRSVVQRMLERAGYRVIAAADGADGIALFKSHGVEINAVVLDMLMPRFDGLQTFETLIELRPHLPVLLMSGFDEQEATRRFRIHRPAGFIQKPFGTDALVSKLSSILKKRLAR